MTLNKEDIFAYIRKALANSEERIVDLLVKQIILYDDKIIVKCRYSYKRDSQDEEMDVTVSEENVILPMTSDNGYTLVPKTVRLFIKV